MTDERLEKIERHYAGLIRKTAWVTELIAEVKRLKAREKELFADGGPVDMFGRAMGLSVIMGGKSHASGAAVQGALAMLRKECGVE